MIYDHDYVRAEFDWVASDDEGHVAYLTTAGAGPLPKEVVDAADRFDDVLATIRSLPMRNLSPASKAYPADWNDAASRGFYSYDWSLDNKRYELVAKPLVPMCIDEIGVFELRELAGLVRLPVRFSESSNISGEL